MFPRTAILILTLFFLCDCPSSAVSIHNQFGWISSATVLCATTSANPETNSDPARAAAYRKAKENARIRKEQAKFRELAKKATEREQQAVQREQDALEREKSAVGSAEKSEIELLELRIAKSESDKKLAKATTRFWYGVLIVGIAGLLLVLVLIQSRMQWMTRLLKSEQQSLRNQKLIQNQLEERVARLQRMESLGMLAGGVAHDFNNLLVGVIGNAEILELQGEFKEDEFTRDRLDQIIQSAEKAADLSRQMLAYTGKSQIKKKSTDLNELIGRFAGVMKSTCGKGIEIVLDFAESPVVADVDSTQIEQILLNLSSNANDAITSSADKIIIRTGFESIDNVDRDPLLHGRRELGGDFVFFEVVDFGRGMTEEQIRRIFEPFYSTNEHGRGLGLAVVYGLVNGHDGLIRTHAAVGEGSSFRVLLPLSHSPESITNTTVQNSDRVNFTPPEELPTILVVDDEPSVRNMASSLLTSLGWNVLVAENGLEGLEIINNTLVQIDCMLLDVVMPIMGAQEVLQQMQQMNSGVPVVLMSGHSEHQLSKYCVREQVTATLAKPFRLQELVSAVNQAIKRPSHFKNLK